MKLVYKFKPLKRDQYGDIDYSCVVGGFEFMLCEYELKKFLFKKDIEEGFTVTFCKTDAPEHFEIKYNSDATYSKKVLPDGHQVHFRIAVRSQVIRLYKAGYRYCYIT